MAFFSAMAKLDVSPKLIAHAENKKLLAKLKKPPSKQIKKKAGSVTW